MMNSSEKSEKYQVYQTFMQKSAEEYYEKQAGVPEPPDLSFIEQSRRSKGVRSAKKYSAIAADVLIVLIGGIYIGGLFTGGNKGQELRITKLPLTEDDQISTQN